MGKTQGYVIYLVQSGCTDRLLRNTRRCDLRVLRDSRSELRHGCIRWRASPAEYLLRCLGSVIRVQINRLTTFPTLKTLGINRL
jgi:hypothetical protein